MMQKRVSYFDGLKFLAMMMVFTTHYMAEFNYNVFEKLPKIVRFITVYGITGKMGVAFFGVILGYFASMSKKETVDYVVNRYIYFFFSGLLINFIIFLLPTVYKGWFVEGDFGVVTLLKTSLLISDDIYPTFWCMIDFLIASIICYLNGKYKVGIVEVIVEMGVLIYFEQLWVCICLAGYLFRLLNEEQVVRKVFEKKVAVVIPIAFFFLCKQEESEIIYLINGLFVVVLLLYLDNHNGAKKVIGSKSIASLGQVSMGMYLIHVVCYILVGTKFLEVVEKRGHYGMWMCLGWLCSLFIICMLAYPLDFILHKLVGIIKLKKGWRKK